ncbi:hypothetical protein [Pseudomonas sp. NBRC 111123]
MSPDTLPATLSLFLDMLETGGLSAARPTNTAVLRQQPTRS